MIEADELKMIEIMAAAGERISPFIALRLCREVIKLRRSEARLLLRVLELEGQR